MDAYRDQYATLFHGGRDVVLLAISTDTPATLAAWAHDAGYPFRFLSDPGGRVGQLYGAFLARAGVDKRNLFVVDSTGRIGHRQVPFREVDPTAYTELAAAINRLTGAARD